MRRVRRLYLETAKKMNIELSADLKVLSWRGRSDPGSCADGKRLLVQSVEMVKSGWISSDARPWRTVAAKQASKYKKSHEMTGDGMIPDSDPTNRASDLAEDETSLMGGDAAAENEDSSIEAICSPAVEACGGEGKTLPNSMFAPNLSSSTGEPDEDSTERNSVSQCKTVAVERNATENEVAAKEEVTGADIKADALDAGQVEEAASEELWKEIEALEVEIAWWKKAFEAAQRDLHAAEAGRRRAEEALVAAKTGGADEGNPQASLIANLILHPAAKVSVSQALRLVSSLFPTRIVVLPSALESASKLDGIYKRGSRLLKLLLRLATDYYEAISEKGDAVARRVFTPDEYSACEAQTTREGALGRIRDFRCGKTMLRMEQHLKIGISADASLTLRCYFAWLASERKLVIGHCGEHLPVSTHK